MLELYSETREERQEIEQRDGRERGGGGGGESRIWEQVRRIRGENVSFSFVFFTGAI